MDEVNADNEIHHFPWLSKNNDHNPLLFGYSPISLECFISSLVLSHSEEPGCCSIIMHCQLVRFGQFELVSLLFFLCFSCCISRCIPAFKISGAISAHCYLQLQWKVQLVYSLIYVNNHKTEGNTLWKRVSEWLHDYEIGAYNGSLAA